MEKFELEVYKKSSEIINQTVAQIMKDFGMFGIEVNFTGHTEMAYNEMFSQLSECIAGMLNTNHHKLWSLLYQIDLSQKAIVNAQIDHPDWTQPDIITELVIHRELKKVLIRNYYKNNPDKL